MLDEKRAAVPVQGFVDIDVVGRDAGVGADFSVRVRQARIANSAEVIGEPGIAGSGPAGFARDVWCDGAHGFAVGPTLLSRKTRSSAHGVCLSGHPAEDIKKLTKQVR